MSSKYLQIWGKFKSFNIYILWMINYMDLDHSNWLDRLHVVLQRLLIIICGLCVLFTISLESAEIFFLIIIIWFMLAAVLGVIYLFLRFIFLVE